MKKNTPNSVLLVVLFSISLVLISCKKKYHVVGRAFNPITGQGIANVKVEFLKSTASLPGGYKEVASTLTDANGNYELEYKGIASRVQTEPYDLYLLGTLYSGTYQSAVTLDHKKKQEIDWHLVPYGKLKTNVNYRINPSDQIFQPGIHYGCINISGTSSDIPMGYYDFTWTVTKTSTGTNTFTGEIFVPEGGIGEFTINY